MSRVEGGGIFVSYRRQESSHVAGRLYDRLTDHFGTSQVFIDVDTIEPGVDFAEAIIRAVETCDVLLAIIGPSWLTATDEQGRRRLEDPDDIVRLEIEAALIRNVRVIPILVEDAVMPKRQDLPQSLASLARRNAFIVRHESFRYDAERLITSIQGVVESRNREQVEKPAKQEKAGAQPSPRLNDSISQWKALTVKSSFTTRTLSIHLSHETHTLEVKIRLAADTVSLDGKVIIQDREISEGKSKIFPIPDGPQSRTANLQVVRGLFLRIDKIKLIIDNQVLYQEGLPRKQAQTKS